MIKIWYIHGAKCSACTFNYFKTKMNLFDSEDICYKMDEEMEDILERLTIKIEKEYLPVIIIAHSLGGVIAAKMLQRTNKIKKVITLSAPFGGLNEVMLFYWLFNSSLYKELLPTGNFVKEICNFDYENRLISFVTIDGSNPFISLPNDGVVTINSQKAIYTKNDYIEVPKNHFEILLDDRTINLIEDMIEEFEYNEL
jgi:triacylglycerol esterase/lipase EstA (alpha/beta hydrolase family)